MEKELYWLVESNGDLSITANNLEDCKHLISGDFDSLDDDEKKEAQYTITPTYLTDEEFSKLPEA